MNQTAKRNIPEEWTPEVWQTHVTEMEKRMNELEREVYNLKQGTPIQSTDRYKESLRQDRETLASFQERVNKGYDDFRPIVNGNTTGTAWLR